MRASEMRGKTAPQSEAPSILLRHSCSISSEPPGTSLATGLVTIRLLHVYIFIYTINILDINSTYNSTMMIYELQL